MRPADRSGLQDSYPLARREQPISQRALGQLGLKDKGRRGQGMEPVAVSLMAPEREKKTIKLQNYGET